MHLKYESSVREPLVEGNKTYSQVTEDIISPIEKKPGRMWYVGFLFSLALLGCGVVSVFWEVYYWFVVLGINLTVGC